MLRRIIWVSGRDREVLACRARSSWAGSDADRAASVAAATARQRASALRSRSWCCPARASACRGLAGKRQRDAEGSVARRRQSRLSRAAKPQAINRTQIRFLVAQRLRRGWCITRTLAGGGTRREPETWVWRHSPTLRVSDAIAWERKSLLAIRGVSGTSNNAQGLP